MSLQTRTTEYSRVFCLPRGKKLLQGDRRTNEINSWSVFAGSGFMPLTEKDSTTCTVSIPVCPPLLRPPTCSPSRARTHTQASAARKLFKAALLLILDSFLRLQQHQGDLCDVESTLILFFFVGSVCSLPAAQLATILRLAALMASVSVMFPWLSFEKRNRMRVFFLHWFSAVIYVICKSILSVMVLNCWSSRRVAGRVIFIVKFVELASLNLWSISSVAIALLIASIVQVYLVVSSHRRLVNIVFYLCVVLARLFTRKTPSATD